MNSISVSLGSAEVLGLIPRKSKIVPSTIFLMNRGKCLFNCAFCTQARESTSKGDLLSRITWPEFELEAVLESLKSADYERVCIQWVNVGHDYHDLLDLSAQVLEVSSKPVSVSVRTFDRDLVAKLLNLGVDKVSLAIDVASENEFEQVKGGNFDQYLKFILELAHSFPGKIGTHVIVGFSETEEELVDLLRKLHSAGVVTSLFAFTPVRGTKLEDQKAPSLEKYRRVQVAFELVKNLRDSRLRFSNYGGQAGLLPAGRQGGTRNGEIVDFGYSKEELLDLLKNTKVFEVNGCEGCSRPYYNERPGGVIYNWPRSLSEEEIREAIAQTGSF